MRRGCGLIYALMAGGCPNGELPGADATGGTAQADSTGPGTTATATGSPTATSEATSSSTSGAQTSTTAPGDSSSSSSLSSSSSSGGGFEGTLLVSGDDTVLEFTIDGTEVSSTPVPAFDPSEPELRDLVVAPDDAFYVFLGTFNPSLAHLDAGSGSWVYDQFAGWSTVNNVSYGGVAVTRTWVWVTDMQTAAATESGLVRFSLVGDPTERVGDSNEYIDVNTGLDAVVYAVRADETTLDSFDAAAGTLVATVTLGAGVRAIAAAADGTLMGASWDGNVYAFAPNGMLLQSMDSGYANLMDIDIATDGTTVAVGSRFGDVVITDTTLAGQSSFDPGAESSFVAFRN